MGSLFAVIFSTPVRCNNTKPRLPISASVESQLHKAITPICLVGIKPAKERKQLLPKYYNFSCGKQSDVDPINRSGCFPSHSQPPLAGENSVKHQDNSSDNNDYEERQIVAQDIRNFKEIDSISKNFKDRDSTSTNNNASRDYNVIGSIAPTEASFALKCNPLEIKLEQGKEGSFTCDIANNTNKTIELALECSGLHGTGIECHINGEQQQRIEKILVKDMSDKSFPVFMVSRSVPPVPAGVYQYTISAECSNTGTDIC
jgi:hypothetical protein